jgi:hypothetical protein
MNELRVQLHFSIPAMNTKAKIEKQYNLSKEDKCVDLNLAQHV